MAHDATSNAPANGTRTVEAPLTDLSSPPKYVPQFSAATEMILKRINSGGAGGLGSFGSLTGTVPPPGYEDMRRSVLEGMKTSYNMEITTPTNTTVSRKSSTKNGAGPASVVKSTSTPTNVSAGRAKAAGKTKGAKVGTKRKRAKADSDSASDSGGMSGLGDDSESDDSKSVTNLPTMTLSGRHVVKPAQFDPAAVVTPTRKRGSTKRTQEQALCKVCLRGHSPQHNMIVFCDGCNSGWHQMCHDPPISEEEVRDETKDWFCAECSKKRGKSTPFDATRGVSWPGGSTEQKRAYLSSLTHPQLVALLLHATVLHPNVPIFPESGSQSGQSPVPQREARIQQAPERRTNNPPQPPFPPAATAGLFTRAEANPNAPINFIRKIPPGSQSADTPPPSNSFPSPANTNHPLTHSSSAPPTLPPQNTQEGDGSRESTPASPPYPRPGNGLMAKLPNDDEDSEWMADVNDFEAFSHVVYNGNGEKVEENGVPVAKTV